MTVNATFMTDTHAHLDMEHFNKDRHQLIERAIAAGVRLIITVGTDLESSRKAIDLAEQYPEILAAVGFHPHEVTGIGAAHIKQLAELAEHPRVVAIGEIGLDYYRNYSPREAQLTTIRRQLELASRLSLPVVVHCRQAEADMFSILQEWVSTQPVGADRGVIHCFSGSEDIMRRYLDMGFFLALGAYIGYPKSQLMHSVIRAIPEDKLLVETDCPYLPPQSRRGQRNEPAFIPITIELLAGIRGESTEVIARTTTDNAQRLFHPSEER